MMDNSSRYRVPIIHPSAQVNWGAETENFSIETAKYLRQFFDIELLRGSSPIPWCLYYLQHIKSKRFQS